MTDAQSGDHRTWQGHPPPEPPAASKPAPVDPTRGPKSILRIIWAAAMLLLLGVVWVLTSPGEPPGEQHWASELTLAESAYEVNEANTQGAPQQQVVNGWYANDLAAIHVDQLTAQAAQNTYLGAVNDRIAAVLGVIALTVIGDVALRALPTPAVLAHAARRNAGL